MRGDRPDEDVRGANRRTFTPHARGSTSVGYYQSGTYTVYPACAGIDLGAVEARGYSVSLPRMRGDRPLSHTAHLLFTEFTPHARGSTDPYNLEKNETIVYPACAGIDPKGSSFSSLSCGLPRMRGDRPRKCQ